MALFCVVVMVCAAPNAFAAELDFDPCFETPDYECATLEVPLDRNGGAGALRLHARRLVETREASEVLVAVAGGPGQSSTSFADDFADALAEGLENRQLVVLDPRGTGRSGALVCSAINRLSPAAPAEKIQGRVGKCGEQLGETRRHYTTTEVVEDIEALRRGLGIERLSLFGISYGSYVAQRYARRYPSNTDRLVLDSPVAQDQGGQFDRTSYESVGRVLRQLCAEGRCRGITRTPLGDLRRLAARLRRRALTARVFDQAGKPVTVRLTNEAKLFDLLLSSDFSPVLRGALPAAVRSATRGDRAPLLRLLAIDEDSADPREFDEQNESPQEFSNALFFTTTCQEKPLPWGGPEAPLAGRQSSRAAALAMLPNSAFSPFGRRAASSTQVGTTFCERWPVTNIAPVPDPGPIEAPALVLSGLADLRTPLREARKTAALITDSSLVTVADAPHSLVSSRLACVQTALTRFFGEEAVGNPCAGDAAPGLTPRLAPLAPRRLGSPRGKILRPRTRTVRALLATVRDAAMVVATRGALDGPFAFGGLRGGSTCARPGARAKAGRRPIVLRLRRSSYIPGLLVTGRVVVRHNRVTTMRVSVSGGGAARGQVRLAGRRVVGRLAGRRVRMRLSTAQLSVARLSATPSLSSAERRAC